MVTFDAPDGPPDLTATGGFRGRHFVLLVEASAQKLALVASVPHDEKLTELRGAFATYGEGRRPVPGDFVLRPAGSVNGAPQPSRPLASMRAFLKALHE
jgi:hypothetical protein